MKTTTNIPRQKRLWPNSQIGNYMVSIDPGINVGWALWDWTDRICISALYPPVSYGLVPDPGGKISWEQRADMVMEQLDTELGANPHTAKALIEMPQLMESQGAMVSARSGSLVKLTMMVGRIQQLCFSMGMDVELVEVRDWKGQMPKSAVDAAIGRRLGLPFLKGCPEHTRDAVGLGLWAKGHFQGQEQ